MRIRSLARPIAMQEHGHVLTEDDRRELLRIARSALREYFRSGRSPPGLPHQPSLLAPAAVFVTLHSVDPRSGAPGQTGQLELRGCIGGVTPSQPLYRAVQQMAVAAATRDRRFDPVAPHELAALQIEISVLGAFRETRDPADIVIGRDGLSVETNEARGLLLPQVASEHGWDAETFLAHTCLKAGLAEDAWRDVTTLVQAFTAEVFHEPVPPTQS